MGCGFFLASFCRAAAIILSTMFMQCSAYPSQWSYKNADSIRRLTPGGSFGPMHIQRFENLSTDACILRSNIPASGFVPNTTYQIIVSTSAAGGAGFLITPTGGEFAGADPYLPYPRAIYTEYSTKFETMTYDWKSPSVDARSQFFAICAAGSDELARKNYPTKVYLAPMMQITQQGVPPLATCSTSIVNTLGTPCWCSDSDVTTWCEAGLCCSPKRSCGECTTAPPKPTQPAKKASSKPTQHPNGPVFLIVVAASAPTVLFLISIFGRCVCNRRAQARTIVQESNANLVG